MEQKIENAIDYTLENLAPLFYRSSIIIGILLALLGLLLYFRKSSKKKLKTVSLITIGIGIFAILSGIMQMKY
ncbi:hypothetical protein [Neobacillus massiliamazoniensis]|jgi:uncharacterized membrane protein HdeD (DUF308 family)|uniref:LPXTG cell wall anchor domain-containing protein n=1 Tax=Neobacillus massiliamazoniensis TaxID=1499688 RepID=A0A0U1P0T0_9BACI|nr:hypothetical protein [Neobacillus massiliamazoniensis]CRK83860.1 hypothetical protein BN000_03855 [Neobacillus massiliamazoniensis]